MLSLFFFLSQTAISYAKTDESSEVVYFEDTESSTSQQNAEPATDEVTSESSENSKDKKSKDEAPESAVPESTVMSMMSGGSSSSATGGVFSNPQAASVSQVGAATFSYPIAVPPGRNGLQPNIALQYSSYNENGWVGVGWDLDLGSIKRSTKNGLNYSGTDFVAGGSELVPNSAWGSNYYCKKIEGAFTKYYFNTGSNYWVAIARDGTKYYYGQDPTTRMASGSNTYSWHLDRVEDTNGNYMSITYTKFNNQIYPNVISYTGNTGGLSTNKTVEFGLADRTDIISSYKTKYLVNTVKRLQTITVKADGTTVYKYVLNYDNSGPNGRSRLAQIRRVTPNAVEPYDETNSLPPTDFSWINGGDGTFGSVSSIGLPGPAGGTIMFGDINGDGKKDFIKVYASISGVTVYPYFANSSGGFTAEASISFGSSYPIVALGDINGDGKADIVNKRLSSTQIRAYLSNGDGTFSVQHTSYVSGSNCDSIQLADLNGDGKADLVMSESGYAGVYTSLSSGDGYFQPSDYKIVVSSSSWSSWSSKTKVADFNGDGNADLLISASYSKAPSTEGVYIKIWYGDGDGGFSSSYVVFTMELPDSVFSEFWLGKETICDANGDGLADVAYIVDGTIFGDPGIYLVVQLSKGTSTTGKSTLIENGEPSFADINDDGTDDLILSDSSNNNLFYKSNGDGTFASSISAGGPEGIPGGPLAAMPIFPADINGDGRADMIKYYGTYISYSMAHGDDAGAGDHIELITNPLGGETSITYGNSTDISINMVPFELHPVMDIVTDDGYNDISVTTYAYSGAYYDYEERDFRGFSTVTQTNPDLTTIKTTYEQLNDYKKGRPLLVEMKNPSGSLLKKKTLTWEAGPLGDTDAKFVKLTNKREDIYGTTNVYTNEAYPIYSSIHGGLEITVKSGSGSAENVTIFNAYINKGTWLWRKASEALTGSSTGLVREINYTYDDYGNLKKKIYYNNNGPDPEEEYYYHPTLYGVLISYDDPKNNTTSYSYDSTYTHVTGIQYPATGGATHSVSMAYNEFGKLDYEIDENDYITDYEYDAYGRLDEVYYPDGGHVGYSYQDNASPRYIMKSVKETASSSILSYEYFDGFGRSIQTIRFGEANKSIVTASFYDEMGRKYLTKGPFFSTGIGYPKSSGSCPFVQISYDYHGRPIAIHRPDQSGGPNITHFIYDGFAVNVEDADFKQKQEKMDYLGRIVEVIEFDDNDAYTTNYQYNAAGDLTQVYSNEGNYIEIHYDTLGRKTSMLDNDMGYWQYGYDSNGNLLWQSDNKQQYTNFTYDQLNRVLTKHADNAPTVDYLYDTTTNSIGRLSAVNNGNSTTIYNEYDSMGRVLEETKTITGLSRTTNYEYDFSGKLVKTTYPGGYFYVENNFISGTNLLSSVTASDGVTYAWITDYTPEGKIGIIQHQNGTRTTYDYSPYSTRLVGLETKDTDNTPIQSRTYTYSGVGNITQIHDSVDNITYNYLYDDLHRLTSETNTGSYDNISITYMPNGNIETKTIGSNTFVYGYSGNHAVRSVVYNGQYYPYNYDGNGNLTSGPDFTNLSDIKTRTISYDGNNMPSVINHSSGVSTYLYYDGFGSRVKKTVSVGYTNTNTYYFGDHFEFKIGDGMPDEEIIYIFAGNLRVAQVKGNDRTRTYFHKDHLGSSTVMTNDSGYEIESSNYMPFGGMRDHSGTDTSAYKFTDQELDSENGLYNYNARLYDPIIGRFISPDTIVPQPFNPQSLNRYSYCLNNPLIYTDPSGHEEQLTPEIFAALQELWYFLNGLGYNFNNAYELGASISGLNLWNLNFAGSSGLNLWNSGFEDLDAWMNVKPLHYGGGGGGLSKPYNNDDAKKLPEVQGDPNNPQHKAADAGLRLAAIQIKPENRKHLEYFGYVYENGFFRKLLGADGDYGITYPQPLGDGGGWPHYARNMPSLTVAVYHDHYFPNEPWNEYFSGGDLNYATEMGIGIYMVSPSGVMKYWHPNNPGEVEIIGHFP